MPAGVEGEEQDEAGAEGLQGEQETRGKGAWASA